MRDGRHFSAHGVNSVAAKVFRKHVAIEHMLHPSELRLGLLAEWPGFEQSDLKP